jgi:hypothetical protein
MLFKNAAATPNPVSFGEVIELFLIHLNLIMCFHL